MSTLDDMKKQGWFIETEELIIPMGYWVARLRDEMGYLQETGKGRTEQEALDRLEKNFISTQKAYKK